MQSTTIAVDLAKNVFEIAISRHPGKVAERHRVSRSRLLPFFGYLARLSILAGSATRFRTVAENTTAVVSS